MDRSEPLRRVPVLLVSGFLGSGKTTLVRAFLAESQRRGLRAAVISNEFGELGIDEALLGGGREEFVELAGGCVCCRLSDELVDTLESLKQRVDPDLIVIETSGVALPFETQLNLYRDPVNRWVGDEACVVVVSATAMEDERGETWETQVSGADLVVVSKVDLVDSAAVRREIERVNAGVPIIEAIRGDVSFDLMFPRGPGQPEAVGRPHHHEAFVSSELRMPEGLTDALALVWLDERRGLRTKGFVRTTGGTRIVQGVGRRMELLPTEGLVVAERLIGRVVVIDRVAGQVVHPPGHHA